MRMNEGMDEMDTNACSPSFRMRVSLRAEYVWMAPSVLSEIPRYLPENRVRERWSAGAVKSTSE